MMDLTQQLVSLQQRFNLIVSAFEGTKPILEEKDKSIIKFHQEVKR